MLRQLAHGPIIRKGLSGLTLTYSAHTTAFRVSLVRRAARRESHHKCRATTPGVSKGRPSGCFSCSLGASDALDDGSPSPARDLLPGEQEKQSYGYHMSKSDH